MSLFPHYSEIRVIKGKGVRSSNYGRSVWLGLTQGLINAPRMLLMGVFVGLRVALVGTFLGAYGILFGGILLPILATFTLVVVGLMGKLTIEGEPEADGAAALSLEFKARL